MFNGMDGKLLLYMLVWRFWFSFSVFRSECRRHALFVAVQKGFVLSRNVITSYRVTTHIECASRCLVTKNCYSYNYEEGEIIYHTCQLNNATRFTKPKDFEEHDRFVYYESIAEIGPRCSPNLCSKGEICAETCSNSKGYLCKKPVAKESNNFMAIFSNGTRLQYQGTIPQMTELTVCFWFWKVEDNHSTFRYDKVLTSSGKIKAFSHKEKLGFAMGSQKWRYAPHNQIKSAWSHVCWQWENTHGNWTYYLNGFALRSESNYSVGTVIPANGRFSFGIDGNVEKKTKMSHLDVWSYVLTEYQIKRLWKGCTSDEGDAVQWRGFRDLIFGPVKKRENAECTLPSPIVQKQRDQYCENLDPNTVALFDIKFSRPGRLWRCYSRSALTVDTEYGGYKYDTTVGSDSFSTKHSQLVAIVE